MTIVEQIHYVNIDKPVRWSRLLKVKILVIIEVHL
jgi:hypothetical protein